MAIHFVDDGRKLTFKEIDQQANKVAHLLAKHVRTLFLFPHVFGMIG